MTSDKFMYLFGRIIPSMSLVISMTLRFVPNFINQLKNVSNAQKCIGKDLKNENILKKIKHGLSILSIVVTWAFENSIETADSMNARGYGVTKRTAFSIYTLDKRDKKALLTFLFLGIYILVGYINGGMYFKFFPSIRSVSFSGYSFSVLFAYFLLSISPIIIEIWEALRWKSLKSKI
jgi:energy-coupling factor transport system permease protein